MGEDDNRKNIIKILICFCIGFFILIGYLTYFEIHDGENVLSKPNNMRNKDKENSILRGSIYDRNMNLIVDSARQSDGTQKRVYKDKYGEPFAPVIGYYSSKYGTSGLEQSYANTMLDASILNPFKVIKDIMTKADRKGNSLVLTIDSNLQKIAYDALGNNRGAVVAMDPKTGEILCMVSKPVFNPATIDKDWNTLLKQDEEGVFINRATQPKVYPPGSTFKVIVASKALENIDGIDTKKFECKGSIKIGNYTLHDFEGERHGSINLHNALVDSCNVTFGQVGVALGADRLKSGAEDFFFNKDLNKLIPDFGLPISESIFPDIDKNRNDSLAQSSIGQYEVTATPLEMMLVASAVANGGTIMKPYLVKSIVDNYGWSLQNTKPTVLGQPIKSETADTVKDMMIDVVKKGTGRNAKITGMDVAGKTGTADVGNGQQPHSWFIGFAPADNPRIAIAVIVENGEIGGGKAAMITREILKSYLK